MLTILKTRINTFLSNGKQYPLFTALMAGLYPLLFFYSNNYNSVNSLPHFLLFGLLYLGIPILIIGGAWLVCTKIKKLTPYRTHILLVLFTAVFLVLLSQSVYFTVKKKLILGALIVVVIFSRQLHVHLKKFLLVLIVVSIMPLIKNSINIYEDITATAWTAQPDRILDVTFKKTPNIYMIQPDGYISRPSMEKAPYSYKNIMYSWLESNNFKVYDGFRSNYPASLASNASMFAMKHHYFDNSLFPSIEMPNAREVIVNNDVVKVLKNNNYKTFFIAHDEYFQQNLPQGNYDNYNIDLQDIPLITNGGKLEQDAYSDLKSAMAVKTNGPKFFFVEKVLPHHIHFDGPIETRVEDERNQYLKNTEEANIWLKKTIAVINSQDPGAVILILADHGGWVGIRDENVFYSTYDKSLIYSTFNTLAAIKWDDNDFSSYDAGLVSNVNVFRVLFAKLSQDKSLLDNLQDNSSYNVRYNNLFTKSVYKLIDDKGEVVKQKYQ